MGNTKMRLYNLYRVFINDVLNFFTNEEATLVPHFPVLHFQLTRLMMMIKNVVVTVCYRMPTFSYTVWSITHVFQLIAVSTNINQFL